MARGLTLFQRFTDPKFRGRSVVAVFLGLFVPSAILITGLFFLSLHFRVDQELTALKSKEKGHVEATAQVLKHDFEVVTSDLLVLSNAPFVRRFIESGSEADKKGVSELFVDVSQQKRDYDQIRYLDSAGMELIRVDLRDGRATAVSEADLQNKKGRYYFTDSIRLSEGEIYVSPLDLNIEHGKIETPYKPMVRIGTPVFNGQGEAKGVVLLNLYGAKLIGHFRTMMGSESHEMLLNRDGDWLSSQDPSQDWGFMFGNPHAFAKRYPTEWEKLSANSEGTFSTEAGLITYATVYPLLPKQHSSNGSTLPEGTSVQNLGRDEYFLKVVSFVPVGEVPSITINRYWVSFAGVGIVLAMMALLSAYVSVLLLNRRQLQHTVFDNERRLREITATLGEGVFVLDSAGLITYINPEAERLLGWSSEDVLGKSSHALFHHHLADGALVSEDDCPIKNVIQTGKVYRGDEGFWRKDGTLLPADVSSSPIIRDGKVAGSVVVFGDLTDRQRAQEEIRRLAFYDTLTDLPNRRQLLDRFNYALAQAKRHKRSLAIMFLDLDHFKEINDTLGHDVGDELLKVVAERLRGCVRSGDTVARQGGDEFVVLISEIAHPADASQVAEKLLSVIAEPVSTTEHSLEVTGSVGIAIYPIDGSDDAQDLMKKADIAMYAAKHAGRNCYCIHGAEPCHGTGISSESQS